MDTRLKSEWDKGHIEGTVHGPTPDLRHLFADLPADHPLVLFCSTSRRAVLGASILRQRGFTNVTLFVGGITGWNSAGYPLVR